VICIAVRPFNPEGVAPIESIDFKSNRIAYVNKTVGVVFAEDPDGIICSNGKDGDVAYLLMRSDDIRGLFDKSVKHPNVFCKQGLAHAAVGFSFELKPDESKQVHCSAALETDEVLRRSPVKQTWRVSFGQRRIEQRERWKQEIEKGVLFTMADKSLQDLFDACRATLIQFHDGEFISPGPYTYHKFWFRDAAIMLTALTTLGYSKRSAQGLDVFPERLTQDGFFRGPDGEWDSNGLVIWAIYRYYELNRSELWLREWYPLLEKAAGWIPRMRRKSRSNGATVKGLMPKSLSAEHLGMVDQYYWDSFWSLAGLKCMEGIAGILGKDATAVEFKKEAERFEHDIIQSTRNFEEKLGEKVFPASPGRPFDEGAIGSICSVYPLELFDGNVPHGRNTLSMIADRYVDGKGFFHPLIHSGYNPYLTLQIAHGFLLTGDTKRAWEIAETVFKQATSTYTYPEAIHPVTGGGTMGDGHHGWAAAEIIMFIRDCLFRENGTVLELFKGDNGRLIQSNIDCVFRDVPTSFGRIGVGIQYASSRKCTISFTNKYYRNTHPEAIEMHLPYEASEIVVGNPDFIQTLETGRGRSFLRLSPSITKLYVTMG